jgi:hypothetical protein
MDAERFAPAGLQEVNDMAIRIRVYPSGMGAYGALGGVNRYGGAVSAATYYNSKLASTKQVANLQLGYERALADERVERARLEERLKNPYAMLGGVGLTGYSPVTAAYNPWAASMLGSSLLGSSSSFFGSLGLGGIL